MVKITIGGRFIRPDGSAGFQQLNDQGQLVESETNAGDIVVQTTDNLLSQSGKLSTGHLMVNQMQTAFDSSIAELTSQMREPGSGLVFDEYKTQLRAKADEVKSGFFTRIPQDGVNSNQISMLFDDYVEAKINNALTVGRKASSDRTREEFFASYKQLYNQAAAAPEDMVPHYMNQMTLLMRDAGVTGAFGKSEREYLQKQATNELVKNRIDTLIESDPHRALEVIETSGASMGLSDDELATYKDDAALVAAQFDRQRETDEQLMLRIESQKKRQEFEKAKELASRNEYLALNLAKDRNKFDPQQREELKLTISEAQRKQIETDKNNAELLNRIDLALKAGPAALGAISPKEINAAYEVEVASLEQSTGQGLSLTERADLASKYSGKEVASFTNSLAASLASGDQNAVVEAIQVVDYLKDRNPALLQGLKKEQKDALAVGLNLLSNIPKGQRTEEDYTRALQQGYIETSKAFIDGQKQAEKDEIAFEKRFQKKYNINSEEFQENLAGLQNQLRDNSWLNTLTMGYFGDAGERDFEMAPENATRFQEILKEKERIYGDTLPTSAIYAMAGEEMIQTMGQIPHSADKTIYPFDPRKEFGPGADAIFSNARMEAAAELAAQARINNQNVTAEDVAETIVFKPVQAFRGGLPTDQQGNPERSFIVMTTDGKMMFGEDGQPMVVKASKALAESASRFQQQIDVNKDQLDKAIKNVTAQTTIVDRLSSQIAGVRGKTKVKSSELSDLKAALRHEDVLQAKTGLPSERREELEAQIQKAEQELSDAQTQQLENIPKEKLKEYDKAVELLDQALRNQEDFENKIKVGKEEMASSTIKVVAGLSGQSLVQTKPGVSAKPKTNVRLETAENPVNTANKILQDRIASQNQALKKKGEAALESAQQLEERYQQLRDLSTVENTSKFTQYMKTIDTMVAPLPAEFASIAKNTAILSTRPESGGRALTDSEKEAIRRVGTAMTTLGANLSPSEGSSLRAIGHHLGQVDRLPEDSIGGLMTANRQVAEAMTRLATNEPTHPVAKSLKEVPEVVEYLATTKEDKMRTKQVKELDKMDERGLQSTINALQDAFNNLLPSLQNDQMEKANIITNKLNELQFKKGTGRDVQNLIKDIAELLGYKVEKKSSKKKKTKRSNRFLGGK